MTKTKESEVAEAPVEMKDLSEFDELQKAQEEGISVEIKGPDGKPLGFSIRIAGPDSELQAKAVATIANERMEAGEVGRQLTMEEIMSNKIRGLALSTMGWDKFKLDGDVYKFSVENAQKLYTRFPWMREQVEGPAGRRADFLKKPRRHVAEPSDGL